MCQFSKKSERVKIFFVDLVWNDPYIDRLSLTFIEWEAVHGFRINGISKGTAKH